MSDEQKNDFWSSSSNDDFWNKPVGDDWLKKDEPKPETNEPSWNENPYYQSHVHEDEVKVCFMRKTQTVLTGTRQQTMFTVNRNRTIFIPEKYRSNRRKEYMYILLSV